MGAKQLFVERWLASEHAPQPGKIAAQVQVHRRFDGPPILVPFAEMDYWFVTTAITWTDDKSVPSVITVPRGFTTDLASVPRLFWSIFPPVGSYGLPAIMHDWLYWDQMVSRQTADQIFDAAMTEMDTPAWKRFFIYRALRLFGWAAWSGNIRAKARGDKRVLKNFPKDPSMKWRQWRLVPGVFQ